MSIPSDARFQRALVSLEGLSVGDAFGERFFVHPHMAQLLFGGRALPAPPWPYTDDTQMALSIVETLKQHGAIDRQYLAHSFGRHYDISRGYGPAMHQLLPKIRSGISWSKAAHSLFGEKARSATAPPCASPRSAPTLLTTWMPWSSTPGDPLKSHMPIPKPRPAQSP